MKTARQLLYDESRSRSDPDEIWKSAAFRMKRIAYANGYDDCLSRFQALATIIASTVTKAQLIQLLKAEVAGAEAGFESALHQAETRHPKRP